MKASYYSPVKGSKKLKRANSEQVVQIMSQSHRTDKKELLEQSASRNNEKLPSIHKTEVLTQKKSMIVPQKINTETAQQSQAVTTTQE